MHRAISQRPRSAAVVGALLLLLAVRLAMPGADASASVMAGEPASADPHVPAGFFGTSADPFEPSQAQAQVIQAQSIRLDSYGAANKQELEGDLRAIIRRWFQTASKSSKGKLTGDETQISVHVRKLSTGVELASVKGERLMRPASNLKIATSAAGLLLMGPWGEGEFRTSFEADGAISGGVLRGDLIVHAGGDPLVRDGSLGATESRLDEVARALKEAGVMRITGDIVLDEGTYLEPGIGPSWPSANQHWDDYCARAAGLTVNGGVLVAEVTPSMSGGKARVEVHPSPHGLKNNYNISTVSGTINDVRVGATSSSVTVKGKIGSKAGTIIADFAHPDPVGMFGTVLFDRLFRGGVSIDGGVIRRRGPPPGENVLFTLTSPVLDCLVPINTHSDNGTADQLFFAMGDRVAGAGTREGGSRAVRQALEMLQLDPEGLVLVDGSGLSRDNRISPVQLTGLLYGALAGLSEVDATSQAYLDSLAAMGKSGTLSSRMRGTAAEGRVFAKTGFIDGTSSLSGIVFPEVGGPVLFSIVVNYPTIGGLNTKAWKPMQNEMVSRLLELQLGL